MKIEPSSLFVNRSTLDKKASNVVSTIFFYVNPSEDKNYEFT